MNDQNFRDWFKDIITNLYKNENAGFAIMLIVLPLLERYLREKSGTREDSSLNDKFFDFFEEIFPEIINRANAISFWGVFRHGLSHQAAFSRKDYRGMKAPYGGLSYDVSAIQIISGNIWVNPRMFAQRVIERIEKEFSTFEAMHSDKHKLPTVGWVLPTVCGTATPEVWPLKPPEKK